MWNISNYSSSLRFPVRALLLFQFEHYPLKKPPFGRNTALKKFFEENRKLFYFKFWVTRLFNRQEVNNCSFNETMRGSRQSQRSIPIKWWDSEGKNIQSRQNVVLMNLNKMFQDAFGRRVG